MRSNKKTTAYLTNRETVVVYNNYQKTRQKSKTYPATDQMSMFVAVDLLIILEHAMTGAGTHEVIVALTGCQAAAHCGTRLVAAFTSLREIKDDGHETQNV